MTPYLDRFRYKPGSIGIPIPVQEVRLVNDRDEEVPVGEVGEIVSRGPIVMKGYWNNPEETKEAMRNGWFHTGDLARSDEDGYYYIVGRKKEMIISSGFNVYPKEIEEVLYQHPKIADAAVIGVPHEYRGEVVKAYIILKPGVQAAPEEIVEYCRSKLAVFKAPTLVEFREDLPRTASGKVLKRILREEAMNRGASGSGGLENRKKRTERVEEEEGKK
jgi:long-chain acyl-CoA synthetase